jgi:hypothetical protein
MDLIQTQMCCTHWKSKGISIHMIFFADFINYILSAKIRIKAFVFIESNRKTSIDFSWVVRTVLRESMAVCARLSRSKRSRLCQQKVWRR